MPKQTETTNLDKKAKTWAWGLAEACNAALENKAKADSETFLEVVKKIQNEAYKAGHAACDCGR